MTDPDRDRILRDHEQRMAHLRERRELLNETSDERTLTLRAMLAALREQGKPFGLAALQGILTVADNLPERCELTAFGVRQAIEDPEGYNAARMRSAAQDLREIASTLEYLADALDHEDAFPSEA